MSDTAERTAAIARVKLYVPTTHPPTISDAEVETIVDECKRASRWTAGTAYTYGTVVRPTVSNGHYYVCEQAGTSAATEPDWPEGRRAVITDGASDPVLTWREAGYAASGIFDVALAIHKAWVIKAARAAQLVKIDGQNYQHIYEHCQQMAAHTSPLDFN